MNDAKRQNAGTTESPHGSSFGSPAGSRRRKSTAGSPKSRKSSGRSSPADKLGSQGGKGDGDFDMLSVDILKSVIFLNGKLKEMTDKLHGPEAWQKMRFDRPHELVEMLDDLLNGNDETSSDIVRGLSLHDASRHRPDIDHPMPLHSLDVFKDPSLASLRRFAHTAPKKLIDFWQAAAVECLLGSTVQAFLSFLEDETNGSREVLTVKALVEDLVLALRPVVADRGETMSTEPSMVFANMKESSERGWNGQPKDSDSSFRWMVVATWCSEREEDIIAIMEVSGEVFASGRGLLRPALIPRVAAEQRRRARQARHSTVGSHGTHFPICLRLRYAMPATDVSPAGVRTRSTCG
eukprot:2753956-Rhodomonas_salina.2